MEVSLYKGEVFLWDRFFFFSLEKIEAEAVCGSNKEAWG